MNELDYTQGFAEAERKFYHPEIINQADPAYLAKQRKNVVDKLNGSGPEFDPIPLRRALIGAAKIFGLASTVYIVGSGVVETGLAIRALIAANKIIAGVAAVIVLLWLCRDRADGGGATTQSSGDTYNVNVNVGPGNLTVNGKQY